MAKVAHRATAIVLGLTVAFGSSVAFAQAPTAPKPGQPDSTKSPTDKGAAEGTKGSTAGFKGRHTMAGEVTEIDNKSGKFSLKTKEGMTLDLHAPPPALANVKKGDRLSVEIAVKPDGAGPAAGPTTSDKKQ